MENSSQLKLRNNEIVEKMNNIGINLDNIKVANLCKICYNNSNIFCCLWNKQILEAQSPEQLKEDITMKTLNINSEVRIKLTPFGIKRLKENYEEIRKDYPHVTDEFKLPEVDENGFSKMPLWRVMNNFGDLLFNGSSNPPFEINIQIDDADLEEFKEQPKTLFKLCTPYYYRVCYFFC